MSRQQRKPCVAVEPVCSGSVTGSAVDTAPREPLPAPPKGFRKHMGLKVKLQALLIHGAVYDCDGIQITDLNLIEWDHCPPLMQREYNAFNGDTIPPANDPAYIIPRFCGTHKAKTARKDIPEISKTKRLADEQYAFRARILAKNDPESDFKGSMSGLERSQRPKRKIPSRPFAKRRKAPQTSKN